MKSPDMANYLPIRIGAIVPICAELCTGGCGPRHPGQGTHALPNSRSTLLVYMPVMMRPPSEHPDLPFVGGQHTPPIEINQVQVANNQSAQQAVSHLNWN